MIGCLIKIKPSTALKILKFLPCKRNIGICEYFRLIYVKKQLKNLGVDFSKYPKFSGCPHYPVPHPTDSPGTAFILYKHWNKDTEYGRNRYHFLDWLIAEYEKIGM